MMVNESDIFDFSSYLREKRLTLASDIDASSSLTINHPGQAHQNLDEHSCRTPHKKNNLSGKYE